MTNDLFKPDHLLTFLPLSITKINKNVKQKSVLIVKDIHTFFCHCSMKVAEKKISIIELSKLTIESSFKPELPKLLSI